MRTNGIVLFDPSFDDLAHLLQRTEQIGIQDLFPECPVEAFDVGILSRLAGLDMCQVNAMLLGPASSRWEINSGPLSMRICWGTPRQSKSTSRTEITRSAGSEVSTSIHSASRLKSSKMFKVRKARPFARLSLMKSSDQLWFARDRPSPTWAVPAGSRFFGFVANSAKLQYTR